MSRHRGRRRGGCGIADSKVSAVEVGGRIKVYW